MNLYAMLSSGFGSHEATALCAKLTAWHDAMVAHERKLRKGSGGEICDDECPHMEADLLWKEAVATFGSRAHELIFLRTRALGATARAIDDAATHPDLLSVTGATGHREYRETAGHST
ncbi:MAG: hypothetical protein QM736_23390 [Vicinamibacterales bacterium]